MGNLETKTYESLDETLSFYGVHCNEPYYISSGNPIFEYPDKPFRIDFYACCMCISGEITVEIDNERFRISSNGFLISAPSTILKFVETSPDFRMKLLFFDKTFLLKNVANPFVVEKMDLFPNQSFNVHQADAEAAKRLYSLLEYLEEIRERQSRFAEDMIRSIIFTLLLEIASLLECRQTSLKDEAHIDSNGLYFKFTKLVQEHIATQRNVQFYAEKLFISSKYLIQVVKKASGKTPHVIIDEFLLKEAYVLLGFRERTISQIAIETGFNSSSSFGRFFKKHTGMSPQQYRQQLFG